jgi:hypothetical protein
MTRGSMPCVFLVACSSGYEANYSADGPDSPLGAFSLERVVPDSGPPDGGTSVVLTGTGFVDDAVVTVGGHTCVAITVISSVEIACTTPAGAPGEANIAVVRPEDGARAVIGFLYTSEGDAGDGGSGDGGSGDGGSGDGGTDSGDPRTWDVDYCHVQYPCSMSLGISAQSENVYVWVFQAGVTDAEGQGTLSSGAAVQVELGVGTDGSDPSAGGWTWETAVYNVDKDGLFEGDWANDEYQATLTAPSSTGAYDYCGRVSVDEGASWTYCDLGDECGGAGSSDGYAPGNSGQLTVE